ncbi:aminotransferase class III-fold pyridoxal phosphate-dependent enzyme [Candidatus Finniella inopinata]|uniref:Aminotransferase class III-fold pyridoxal phosphate-dependent enzyme n=1 Tax=Candidatus Finniella inopinata TaxID=1696036 RepID=A0A4Q7DK51_9PROT|nr:aminotransferase class III-fold pyridoxal phosphate-dependent enzyme [Candidatus Finniella inopinata]RZI46750.1 aminotransferase class III-fold pyridoxal phosphate-dependent enzyme [Candidatus Finniella inopinata]
MMKDWIHHEAQWAVHADADLPIVLSRGQGVWLWDIEGRRYLDMNAAGATLNYGHCHPKILGSLLRQAGCLSLCSHSLHHDQLAAFLEMVCLMTKMDKAVLTGSVFEARQTVVEAAQLWGGQKKGIRCGRTEIIITTPDWQGSSLPSGFRSVPFGDLKAVEKAITPSTCAVVTQAIQDKAGLTIPSKGYLARISDLCRENNILLIVDESQSGLGRSGKALAYQDENIQPDAVILGQALGGGFLTSAALAGSKDLLSLTNAGGCGSPFAAAIGLTSLQVLREENLSERSAELGEYFLNRLRHIESPYIHDIKGQGLWISIEIDPNWRTAQSLCEQLMYMGILADASSETTICLAPPLVIAHEELDWALVRLYQALQGGGILPIQVPLVF